MELIVENEQNLVSISNALLETVKDAIVKTLELEEVTTELEVSLLIVTDDTIREMNNQYRGKDKTTDVLSFPMFYRKGEIKRGDLLGDIVVSAQRAQAQAEMYGHSFSREFSFLVVHSMLHLLGYDHESSSQDEREMRQKEEKILLELGLARG